MRRVVADSETNGLLPDVTRLWCVTARDIDTGEKFGWGPDNLGDFATFAGTVDTWVGHNFLSYDAKVFRKLLGLRIPVSKITDTLIKSRLQYYSRPGGHSLENLGKLVHRPKGVFSDWTQYSQELLDYCHQDTDTNYHVYIYLLTEGKKWGSPEAERLEHGVQHILNEQKDYGFPLNVGEAHRLQTEINTRANQLQQVMETELPDVVRPDKCRLIIPQVKADGTGFAKTNIKYLSDDWDKVVGPHTRLAWEEFSVGSPVQIVRRLEGHWDPIIRTKGFRKYQWDRSLTKEQKDKAGRFMWQICEENLDTLRPSAAKSLKSIREYLMLRSRQSEIDGWFDGLGDDGHVHGYCQGIGAITHRMSHREPNLGNTAGVVSTYGPEFRACFHYGGDDGYVQLGTDASGIQLRVLSHYMNDPEYTKEVVDGDIHDKNLDAMGIDKGTWDEDHSQWSSRGKAKTFIYAWLLGAGDEKVGRICGGDPTFGRQVKTTFLESLPALARLKKEAAIAARVGRLVGLDGRHIEIKGEHFALSCYLQGGESVIMKKAMVLAQQRAHRANLDFRQLVVAHDEFQSRVREDHAEKLGKIQVGAIIDAGLHFKLNCPLDGAYKVGKTWLDTH